MSEEATFMWIIITVIFAIGLGLSVGSGVGMLGVPTTLCFGSGFISMSLISLLSAWKYFAYARKS